VLACSRLVLAAALAASPATPTAGTCPNERADAGADANLGNCLGDAREARRANEPRLAAAAYARALMFAREAYAAGKQGAAADWSSAAGEQIVHYGTEGCALATDLTGEAPRATLTACVELLDEFLADLEAVNASASRSAAAARQRRAELEPLLAGLPAPPEPEVPPMATPTEPRGESTPAVSRVEPKPVPPRRPTGIEAGLGVSAVVAGLAIAGLVAGDRLGRRAHAAALSGPDAADAADDVDLCEAMASAAGCDDLRSARRLFVASGVTLGVALAATALFAGLRVRHARRARVSASWRGPGVAVHF
jgi:hypothetical protein